MDACKPHVKLELYELPRLMVAKNHCSHCHAYQYDEECKDKLNGLKYWHCCFNDKIFSNFIITLEDDRDVIAALFENNANKKELRKRKDFIN